MLAAMAHKLRSEDTLGCGLSHRSFLEIALVVCRRVHETSPGGSRAVGVSPEPASHLAVSMLYYRCVLLCSLCVVSGDPAWHSHLYIN